jgi:hypothetical protein
MMKIYHICEFCQQVFDSAEAEGPDGIVSLQGICEDCAAEMGFSEPALVNRQHYYS